MLTRLGLVITDAWAPWPGDDISLDCLATSVAVAESSGFDSIWVTDDRSQAGAVGVFEAYTLLGALALRSRSARLGALVTAVTSRPPALLAKQVTAVDQLSCGRAVLGIGAEHIGDHEADQQDAPPAQGDRFERLEEALQVFREMFAGDPVNFEGRHYRLEAATNRPRPVQPGGPPVLIGGSGEGRTLRLVADYADACNLSGDEASIRRMIAALENHCAEVGRDPSSITKTMLATVVMAPTAGHTSDRLEQLYANQGPNAPIAPAVIAGSSDEVAQQFANFRDIGIDGLIVNLPDAFDTDNIALVGAAVSRIF